MAKLVHKVVPIILRGRERLEILAFRHPQAGTQLVKGTLENLEKAEDATLRELAEESGIENAVVTRPLGQLTFREIAQHWHLFLCRVPGQLPDQWSFFTKDDGGHRFDFFWHELDKQTDDSWHPDFHRAMTFVRRLFQEEIATLQTAASQVYKEISQ